MAKRIQINTPLYVNLMGEVWFIKGKYRSEFIRMVTEEENDLYESLEFCGKNLGKINDLTDMDIPQLARHFGKAGYKKDGKWFDSMTDEELNK